MASSAAGAVGARPKIVQLKMLNRPHINYHPFPNYNNVVNLRSKFNSILQEKVCKSHFAFLIDPNVNMIQDNYDNLGNLMFQGKTQFWKTIDSGNPFTMETHIAITAKTTDPLTNTSTRTNKIQDQLTLPEIPGQKTFGVKQADDLKQFQILT